MAVKISPANTLPTRFCSSSSQLLTGVEEYFYGFFKNASLGISERNVYRDTVFLRNLKYCYVVLTQ